MVKAKKPIAPAATKIQSVYPSHRPKPTESSLLLQRMKEIDRDFIRQTRQLARVTKEFSKKILEKL